MKRGTRRLPKFRALVRDLGRGETWAVGCLEILWGITADTAPAGDVGHVWTDREIALEVGWSIRTREPEELIEILVHHGWLDRCPVHRLIIHDWRDHADRATRARLKRADAKRRGVDETLGQIRWAFPVGQSRDSQPVENPVENSSVEHSDRAHMRTGAANVVQVHDNDTNPVYKQHVTLQDESPPNQDNRDEAGHARETTVEPFPSLPMSSSEKKEGESFSSEVVDNAAHVGEPNPERSLDGLLTPGIADDPVAVGMARSFHLNVSLTLIARRLTDLREVWTGLVPAGLDTEGNPVLEHPNPEAIEDVVTEIRPEARAPFTVRKARP